MPHVASQLSRDIRSAELFLESPSRRRGAVAMSKRVVEKQHPALAIARQRRKTSNMDELPSLSLRVGMPDNQNWDNVREPSSASESNTPDSSNDSVFEMYSPEEPIESPNSSIYQPSFAAELEDTSTIVVTKRATVVDDPYITSLSAPKKSPRVADDPYVAPLSVTKKSPHVAKKSYFEQLTRPEFSSKAAVAIQNITAIETDNRHLLERAIAAEEAAQLLREKNKSLQHRIDYCVNLHRPKTAPGKAPRAASTGDILSSFNSAYKTSMQRTPQTPPLLQVASQTAPTTPTPSGRRRPTPLKLSQSHLSPSPSRDQNSSPFSAIGIHNMPLTTPQTPTPSSKRRPSPLALSQPLVSPTLPHDLAPSPFPAIAFSANPHPYRRSRPPPVRTSHSYTKLTDNVSPIPGSVNKHTVTYEGVPTSDRPPVQTVSLAEARRREKPLPPMGPMSPSAIPGRVEIGIGYDDLDDRREEEMKKRKGLKVLFRWGKRSQSQIF